MVIYGPDIHPTFQTGISIEQIAREGFSFLAVKASQGTSSSWAAGAKAWLDRGDAAGLVTYCYHYLTTADVNAQAQTAKTAAHGRPVMVDFEDGSGSVDNLRAFLAACARVGLRVPLVYVPRWYWQKVGSVSLAGLPPIVSSRYLTATGYASSIYSQVPDSFWDSYGGGTTTVLQFSDRASVAGQKIDVNAFRGTKEQFRALVYGTGPVPAATSGGIETMGFQDHFRDWAGNDQTVQSWMDHVDQRVYQLSVDLPKFAQAGQAQLTGLQTAVDKLADAVGAAHGIDPAELKAAVADAIREEVTVSGEITIGPTGAQ